MTDPIVFGQAVCVLLACWAMGKWATDTYYTAMDELEEAKRQGPK